MNTKLKNSRIIYAVILFICFASKASAQQGLTLKQVDSIVNERIKKQEEKQVKPSKVQLKGMIQTRFLNSLTPNVGVDCIQNPDPSKVTTNSFDIRRFRLGGKFAVNEKIEVGFLANFAEFKLNPQGKVLENAFVKYKHNKYLNLTVGQFRPSFGLENTLEADVLRSFDFSNQYNETGTNGWQSFQIGAMLAGETEIGTKRLIYTLSVVNGNARNAILDNNNGKLFSNRLQLELSKKHNFRIGWSGGIGKEYNQDTYIVGADITGDLFLAKNFVLELQAEGRQGTNHSVFGKLTALQQEVADLSNYTMRGAYFLPNFRYYTNENYLNSLEFSCRYEYWDSNFKINSNAHTTVTPMFGMELLKEYAGRLGFGIQIDNYKREIEKTATYNSNLLIVQLQARF